MSLKWLTIQAVAGEQRVTDPKLAYAKRLISVHRSGTQYFIVEPNQPPGQLEMAFIASSGDLVVDPGNLFNDGESVFVVYEPGAPGEVIVVPPVMPPEPTVCDAPGVVSVIVNSNNSVTVVLPQMGWYVIRIVPAGGSCDASQVAGGSTGGSDFWTSGALPNGTYKACVLKQCPPSMVSSFTSSAAFVIAAVPALPSNCGARKDPSDTQVKILSMTGFPYTILSGAFPLDTTGEEMRGRHEGFSAVISVTVSVRGGQKVVVALYRSGPLIQYKVAFLPFNGNVTVNFSSITAMPTDDIFVVLGYS